MVKPAGDGVPLLYTSIVLLSVSWTVFVLRVGVRLWRKALGLDDYLMFCGLLLYSVTASICIVCSFLGSGQLAAALTPDIIRKGTKLFFIAEFFYASGAAVIKCSIAFTLLRIAASRQFFTWAIISIMVASGLSAIIFMVGVANICHPITTLWGETTNGTCNPKLDSDISFFFSAIEIVTDFALAILPAILLWDIQMKKTVKFSVIIILGMAAFASCATIVRLRYLSLYSNPAEFMFSTGAIGLWSIIEEGIGIIAGSLPALRPLLSFSIFGRSSAGGSSSTPSNNQKRSRSGHHQLDSGVKMDTLPRMNSVDGDVYGDGGSERHILKRTDVAVTSNARSTISGAWERSQVLGFKPQP
ncbi:hypothetical protein TMatcc_006559 [Talaromyces marneffei ATCC 18224]|uniref:Rhodopsin domain-containing protein n=1 Tax=Talaromyces marneffei (strain ATCC 18224 / CBS 334.59 / QM 7333) TaxID=441960 RepID=B6QA90_TALMQ|nr:uncharacterized protein EYB26_002504 [Talaromyces marneffei]EEA25217.1 conserved hypothetical protein [Talaromyces marneffei ATCC 18224]KAE8553952.1 hypothetical protein EYB25_002490 [Talaromyces marneffei]QGA14848.1 hypothetical protein EYB26_002504 [Talaromyces marneffei]